MNNLNMYCICLHDNNYNDVKKLGYIPVALGKNEFNSNWLRDNKGENISHKNSYYGEYTFHYWFWKNKIDYIENDKWIGFCAYRRFWTSKKNKFSIYNQEDFLANIPEEWNGYDTIIGQDIYVNKFKITKLIKHGLKSLLHYPPAILEKNRNIMFHFNAFHGYGKLEKAIELMNDEDRNDFRNFVLKRNSYNRGNMFICKSTKIIKDYYSSLFPWLEKCEKIFGYKSANYGETRIYAFLAERYLSYWFNKYTKPLIWPVAFFDINKNKIDS